VTSRVGALISLHRRFANSVFSGTKTVELRTRKVNLSAGSILLIYVTTPDAYLAGYATVDFVKTAAPSTVWRQFGPHTALRKSEFDAYVGNREIVSAIGLKEPTRFIKSLSLEALRHLNKRFHPPQFMTLLDSSQLETLAGFALGPKQISMPAAAE